MFQKFAYTSPKNRGVYVDDQKWPKDFVAIFLAITITKIYWIIIEVQKSRRAQRERSRTSLAGSQIGQAGFPCA